MSDFIVGLTGGIGSGKSAAAARFTEHGIAAIDADVAAREVVEPGQPALAAIAERFGPDVLLANGELNRAKLREIIFNNAEHKTWLESLLHPLIRQRIADFLQAATSPYALLVSPLLVESNQKEMVDNVVVVDVPEAIQLERTMARDGNTEQLVRNIMAAQATREQRSAAANFVIDNSADLASLYLQVDDIHRQLLLLAEA
ncbi:dephospho-CoA kinase [Halioxenophilus aromaticivorans]|uniref:Dephospho-CoA kinase n=1 Tax=Halioxenophilus aromaticivorans TaxID=1306992 RepID=A0AAV3TYW8_9ALTE